MNLSRAPVYQNIRCLSTLFPSQSVHSVYNTTVGISKSLGRAIIELDRNLSRGEDPRVYRRKANKLNEKIQKCATLATQAYRDGKGALACDMSLEIQQLKKNTELLNINAAQLLFFSNNQHRKISDHTIDMHGLYSHEALSVLHFYINQTVHKGPYLNVIVGKGPVLGEDIGQYCQQYKLNWAVNPLNKGLIQVTF